jgi:hypothetical protein
MAVIQYISGTVEPTVGEVLTSASASGTVLEYQLMSGTFAGGDAAGQITMTSPAGYDDVLEYCFKDGETVTGSAGAAMTVSGPGALKRYGRLYPEGEMSLIDGRWYCSFHYNLRFPIKYLDEAIIPVDEAEMRDGHY